MPGIDEIATVINTYGITVLIVCLAVYAFIILVKDIYNRIKKLLQEKDSKINQLQDSQTKSIQNVVESKTNKINELNERNEELSELIAQTQKTLLEAIFSAQKQSKINMDLSDQENNIKIDKLLANLLDSVQSDRVSLYAFHNGGVSMDGRNFQKMSCIHQVVKTGIASNQNMMQSVFQSTALPLISQIIQNGYCVYKDIHYLKKEYYVLYDVLNNIGVHSVFCYPIKNENDTILGFIAAEFVNVFDEESEPGESAIKSAMLEYSYRFGGLL